MRVAFFNVQSGVGVTRGYWQYALRAHRYLVPHDSEIVDALVQLVARQQLDVLACAEMEGSSWRSGGVDYVAALAERSPLSHRRFFATQRLGRWLQQGNSLHSAAAHVLTVAHPLPGGGEPRILGETQLAGATPITIFVTHLSLGARARAAQLAHIGGLVQGRARVLLVGDFNTSDEAELAPLLASGLRRVPTGPTYPSWNPTKALDHVLCSADVAIRDAHVEASTRLADHLPIIMELS